ncbi:MAG: Adenylate cyclase 1 [Alphaproteobacteria bacterium MarineAlpha3_Bin4]|nr:MAG: Adenylate cyclase 1 [Alphaproteobacteria bacterium MarineAlpha3_Bin4]
MVQESRAGHILYMALIVIFSALASLALGHRFPLLATAENRLDDFRLATLSPSEPQNSDVVVVAITEDTLATLPYRSPLDRGFIADLLVTLNDAGVRAVALDILFDQATEPAKDEALLGVLKRLKMPVVVSWADADDQLTERQQVFLNTYLEGVTKGHARLQTDPYDGRVRRIFTGIQRNGEFTRGLAPALAVLLGAAVPEAPVPIAYRPGPAPGTSAFRVLPAHAVKLLPRQWLAGKVVLIGADLPHNDRHLSPLSATTGQSGGPTPGVVIHAHILAQLLDGRQAPESELAVEAVAVLALAALGLLLAAVPLSVLAKVATVAAGLVALWIGGFALYAYAGALVPLISPTLSFVLSGSVGSAYVGHRQRRHKRFIHQAFSRFVAAPVVDQLIADPSRLALGGERRQVTSLFTDLADFTTLVERTEPTVLLPVLNEYLDYLCRIVVEQEGTIDKIVGDSLVVIFGAPLEQPDHPARAVACALAMDAFGRQFVAEQRAQGLDFGCTRIGIHTGNAVVGNFGGESFFDYTAQGDTINTASRLESVNKHLGTNVCVSEATAARCPETPFRPVGILVLKGKSEGVEAFEPLSDVDAASTAAYRSAFEAMRDGDPGAEAAFTELLREYPDDTLAAFHAERLAVGEKGVTIVLREK